MAWQMISIRNSIYEKALIDHKWNEDAVEELTLQIHNHSSFFNTNLLN